MSFSAPRVTVVDPNTGNTMGITSVGAISVNTVNIASTTVVGGSIVVTLASVVIVGGSIGISGAVSNASVAGATAFVSLKTGAGRYYGMTAQTTSPGIVTVADGSAGIPIGVYTSGNTSMAMFQPTADGGVPFSTGLVVVGTASSPNVTVHFS